MDSSNTDIDGTSTANLNGTTRIIIKDLLSSYSASDKEEYSDINEVDVHALETVENIDVDTEEQPNKTGTITSSNVILVKDVHYEDLDDNFDDDKEYDRSAMEEYESFPRRINIKQEYYNVECGNVKTYW